MNEVFNLKKNNNKRFKKIMEKIGIMEKWWNFVGKGGGNHG